MNRLVNWLVNIALAAIAVLIIARVGSELGYWPSNAVRAYTQGESAPRLEGVDYRAARKTVLLFVRSNCRFCTESMEFYRRLTALQSVGANSVRIIAVGSEPIAVLKDYLDSHNLATHGIVPDADFTLVKGTPTVAIVDPDGQIEQVWLGLQTGSGERSIIDRLR